MIARFAFSALAAGLATLGCGDYNSPVAPGNTALRFTASLAADAERPNPVVAPGSGSATFSVTTGTSTVYNPGSTGQKTVAYSVTVNGLTGAATSAHIHGPADENSAADLIVPLSITSSERSGLIISGSFSATSDPNVSMDSLLVLMRNGLAYVNVHTATNPDGEIRGQIRLP